MILDGCFCCSAILDGVQVGGLWLKKRHRLAVQCSSRVVVVESPAKAKKIKEYLGSDFEVIASHGHVRDISKKPGAICPDEWSNIRWELTEDGKKKFSQIVQLVKKSKKLILATDPDREGEAISWHIQEELKAQGLLKNIEVERITFSSVTKKAVLDAMQKPRQVSANLVDAYLARRALDYQVGFTLSPILWRKLPGMKSAGRVQSVALRLVCEREAEIHRFVPKEYWTIDATCAGPHGSFTSTMTYWNGEKCEKFSFTSESESQAVAQEIQGSELLVEDITVRTRKRKPFPAFTTSTMQQEGLNKLGFSPSKTDKIAQSLYAGENMDGDGLITYIRTDSTHITPDAVNEIRRAMVSKFGDRYIPEKPRFYMSRPKNAQEAHEAIRPTNPSLRPSQLSKGSRDQRNLYELIWNRTIASQMSDAKIFQIGVDISDPGCNIKFHSYDSRVLFDGFMAAYKPNDPEGFAWSVGHGDILRSLVTGDTVSLVSVDPNQHFTQPPPRYSEATLIQALENDGIGRPSTYSSVLKLLKDREYVQMQSRYLHASGRGQVLTAFLMTYFEQYVDYGFTSKMESQLDSIAGGSEHWEKILDAFWHPFNSTINEVSESTTTYAVMDEVDRLLGDYLFPHNEDGSDPRKCPKCEDGRLSFKPSTSTGGFIGCSNYKTKNCTYTRSIGVIGGDPNDGENGLGTDPRTGGTVFLRTGRFGPYLFLEPCEGSKYKAKTVTVSRYLKRNKMTLAAAVKLLTPLHEVGFHPDDGEVVEVRVGRFNSKNIRHGKYSVKLPKGIEPEDVTMDMALKFLEAEGDSPTRGKRKKKKKKNDTEKSPRGRSAYILYSSHRRKTLAEEQPGMKPSEVMKVLGRDWKALSESDRAPFVKMALEEKASNSRSKEEGEQSRAKSKERRSKQNSRSKEEGEQSRVKSKERRSKQGASGYIVFMKMKRPILKEENPSLTFGEMSKRLGEIWRGLEESEKDEYRRQSTETSSN